MKRTVLPFCILTAALLTGCAGKAPAEPPTASETKAPAAVPATQVTETTAASVPVSLTYLGHGSIRLATAEGKIIYIDPYAGENKDYALPADLILVTHGHEDHNALWKIANRAENCRILTWQEALEHGTHQQFDLGYVQVQAVEAGNNAYHSLDNAVGYVLTFSDGKTLYLSGDTSTTAQMASLREPQLDYAFFCCDGVFNMDMPEAIRCAETVGARHSIPYHMIPSTAGKTFDAGRAAQFTVPGALILAPGETLDLE